MEDREKKANRKVSFLLDRINDFFALDIRSSIANAEYKLARNIYYKIGLELQIKEILLCKKINRNSKAASYGRLALIKSFETDKEVKKIFDNFKRYFESVKKEG
jgi:hypothetical protein